MQDLTNEIEYILDELFMHGLLLIPKYDRQTRNLRGLALPDITPSCVSAAFSASARLAHERAGVYPGDPNKTNRQLHLR